MNRFITLTIFLCSTLLFGQKITGEIILKDLENVYISKMYITNLNNQETTLAGVKGTFSIRAKVGDMLRFTSNRTERKDLVITAPMLAKGHQLITLELIPKEIKEVVLARFKPSGNLQKDSEKLNRIDKAKEIKKMIGLPEPKDSSNTETPPASFANGGFNLNLNSIYDILSGEAKKRKRRLRYEKMQQTIKNVRGTLDDTYFVKLKIPENLIGNFLEFIYISENKNLTSQNVRILSEKYLPIFQQRLSNSHLSEIYSN